MPPPNITKYFLEDEALINFIRKENGMLPLEREKEYIDYLKEVRRRGEKDIAYQNYGRN